MQFKAYSAYLRKTSFYLMLAILIIIPFILWEESISLWSADAIEGLDMAGIAIVTGLLLSLDIYLPVPSSLVSLSAGSLLPPLLGFLTCFTGMTFGCWIGYYTGLAAGKAGLSNYLNQGQITAASGAGNSAGQTSLFRLIACRGVPILAEVSVISAGVSQMNKGCFLFGTSLANAIISAAYVCLGQKIQADGSLYLFIVAVMMLPLGFSTLRYVFARRLPF